MSRPSSSTSPAVFDQGPHAGQQKAQEEQSKEKEQQEEQERSLTGARITAGDTDAEFSSRLVPEVEPALSRTDRRTQCQLCGEFSARRGQQTHRDDCVVVVECQVGDRIPPMFMLDGAPVKFLVGGLPVVPATKAKQLVKMWTSCVGPSGKSLRPQHRGRQYGLGWSDRARQLHMYTELFFLESTEIFHSLDDGHVLVVYFMRDGDEEFTKQYPNIDPRPVANVDLLCMRNGPNFYMGLCYQPSEAQVNGLVHPPPPGVAALLKVPSCCDPVFGCPTCKMMDERANCLCCPACCMHLDGRDWGLTKAIFHQPHHTPAPQQAYFEVAGHAYSMRGGLTTIFNGRTTPHGTWAPADLDEQRWPFWGLALVQKV